MSARENAEFYAKGYAEGLRDAKHIDIAQIIRERDDAQACLYMERLLRLQAEALADKRAAEISMVLA